MELRVDDRVVTPCCEPEDIDVALSGIEDSLLARQRLVDRVVVDGRVFWSIPDALRDIDASARRIDVHSCSISDYVSGVCQTASEHTGAVLEGLARAAVLWEDGDERAAAGVWAQVLDAIEWLTTVGTQVAHLRARSDWEPLVGNLDAALRKLELAWVGADWLHVADLARSEVAPAVEEMGTWCRQVAVHDDHH